MPNYDTFVETEYITNSESRLMAMETVHGLRYAVEETEF